MEIDLSTKRSLPRAIAAIAAIPLLFAACSTAATSAPSGGAAAPTTSLTGANMDALAAAAKAEGTLTAIALPNSWCNYGQMIKDFAAKYGITVNVLNPDGSSGEEIIAVKGSKGSTGPAVPDVVDVGLAFGPDAKAQGLLAPYKVVTWADIPDSAKDADGSWYGDYYGVLAFEVNTAVVKDVPQDWNDLLKPEYKGQIALAGDPTSSNQAISGVWASGFPGGGSLDNAQPGLDFFKKLNDAGNFVPVKAKTADVASGTAPIRIAWTYNALADKDTLKGNPPITVVVPKTGRFGGMYVQAISAYATHPNAARLWMEYLYSDAGQLTWMKGYCNPIRYDAMVKAGSIPADVAALLPDTAGTVLPTLDQVNKATDVITKGWTTTVGVTVK
jgi:putative spermidine/putrescine transport system substrate-binding protein